jgi:uncharacterized RDD family membrane protein YckC
VTINPYEAPAGRVEDVRPEGTRPPLARRLSRLAASIIDGLMYLALGCLSMLFWWPPDFESGAFMGLVYLLCAPLLVVQLYFLWRDGQSLGKKAMRIRIVRTDGSRSSLSRIFLLRMAVPSLLSMIPLAGPIFGLADSLLIFGAPRRCIHDYMADTVVVEAA